VLSVSSFLVYKQLRLNPDQLWSPPFSLRTWAWWTTPLVFDRARELADFKGRNLNAIAIGKDRLWVAGDDAFLAYSTDGGRCWVALDYRVDIEGGSVRTSFKEPAKNPCPAGNSATPAVARAFSPPTIVYAAAEVSKRGIDPELGLSTSRLDFGDVEIGKTAFRSLRITNRGKQAVRASSGKYPFFSIAAEPGIFELVDTKRDCSEAVAPGQFCEVEFSFKPKAARVYTTSIEMNFDAGRILVAEVDVTGRGVPAVTPVQQYTPVLPPARPTPPPWPGPSKKPKLLAMQFKDDGTGEIVADDGTMYEKLAVSAEWRVVPKTSSEWFTNSRGFWWQFVGNTYWATGTGEPDGLWQPNPYAYLCDTCQLRDFSISADSAWALAWTGSGSTTSRSLLFVRDPELRWWPASRSALPEETRLRLTAEESMFSLFARKPYPFFPPWYLLALGVSLVLSLPALIPPPERSLEEIEQTAVENTLASDRPLEPGERDVLGLNTIALGLSRFLRNEKTIAPLTIAINGGWGSGKSSLMNLLRRDLESYGFRPVWFNAWHHQKEEHLLAALLQTIRLEAVPHIWQWQGVLFRLKLLRSRLRRTLPAVALLAGVLVLISTLESNLAAKHGHGFLTWALDLVLKPVGHDHSPFANLPWLTSLLAVTAGLHALFKGLTAFGTSPGALLSTLASTKKAKDLDAQTSFRQRFSEEFREVSAALNPRRTLVIFIDDLDRCSHQNVLQVLEAVNFLVSSGDCFVIIGMARPPVEGAVAYNYKDIAPTLGRQPMEFARDYLDKLINIEVPIQPLGPQAGNMFKPPERAPEQPWNERSLKFGFKAVRWALPLVMSAIVVWGATRLALTIASPLGDLMTRIDESINVAPAPEAGNTTKGSAAATGKTGPAAGSPSVPPVPTGTPPPSVLADARISQFASPDKAPAELLPGRAATVSAWFLISPFYLFELAILLVVLQIVLTTRPNLVTHDSRDFTDALSIWHPLVLSRQETPRAAKRFVNRVRFLAMRQGPGRDSATAWERTLFPDRLQTPKGVEFKRIPEELLVALAAVEQAEPEWIYDKSTFDQMVAGSVSGSANKFSDLFVKARAAHIHRYRPADSGKPNDGDWNNITVYRERFLEIWPQLTVRLTPIDGTATKP
jgi:hypothetical protein